MDSGTRSSEQAATLPRFNFPELRRRRRRAHVAMVRDWSGLPEELLVSFLLAMDVPAAVHSGAVCTSWNAAYTAFRRLRAPSPRQTPCLLYASGALAPGAAALHCPANRHNTTDPLP